MRTGHAVQDLLDVGLVGAPDRVGDLLAGPRGRSLSGGVANCGDLVGPRRATLDGRAVEEQATFVLGPEARELDDVVSRDEVLRQIAAVTGGEFRAGTRCLG